MSVQAALLACGVPHTIARAEAPRAEKAMLEFDITSRARGAAFLAQVLHESVRLQYFEEIASGGAYEGRRDLGNTQPGDGRRYKGRGPIQLTGRSNYRWAGGLLKLPLESNPQLASQHTTGWRIAGLYWKAHGLNALADQGKTVRISEIINGGHNGLASRLALYTITRRLDCRPHDKWAGYTTREHRWIREYDQLRRERRNIARRRVLRRAMSQQANRIQHAAQPRSRGGDGKGMTATRHKRLQSLRARS